MADSSEERYYKRIEEGPKKAMHKTMYEIKMITWVAWNLMFEHGGNLATEINYANGFHDLVLEYQTSSKHPPRYIYRLIQFRHYKSKSMEDESNVNLTLSTREQNEKQISLIKLFKTYQKIIGKIAADKIEDLIIFSNGSINNNFDFFTETNVDRSIGFNGWGKQYRLSTCTIENEQDIMANLRNSCEDYEIIRDFLQKLVFMVDQPPEHKLEELITERIGQFFNVPQIFYNNLYKEISDWYKINENGRMPYLTKRRIQNYLKNAKNLLLHAKEVETILVPDSPALANKQQHLQHLLS